MISENIFNNIKRRVEDCSGISQIRECINKYGRFLTDPALEAIFIEQVEIIKSFDLVSKNTVFEDIVDEIEILGEVVYPFSDHVIDFNYLKGCETEKGNLRSVFQHFKGNKVDIMRYYLIDNEQLNFKLTEYNLKKHLNNLRKEFRKKKGQ